MAKLSINSQRLMNSGFNIPLLGYGVYKTPSEQCEDVVAHALKVGYRHIDSAIMYHNDRQCGEAIRKSGIPRSEIFFTSKIPPNELGYEKTKKHVESSLAACGLGYIDLMLIHAPFGGSANRKGTWQALVEAQEQGKIRSLGVSNYGVPHLKELEQYMQEMEKSGRNPGKISVGQWELHPWLNRSDIEQWCRDRGIVIEAYCPVVRATRFDEPSLQHLAKKHGRSPAQILLRWSLQRGFLPLPKSVTLSRIEENAQLYDFELSEEEVAGLQTSDYSVCSWDPTVTPLEQ